MYDKEVKKKKKRKKGREKKDLLQNLVLVFIVPSENIIWSKYNFDTFDIYIRIAGSEDTRFM